MAKQQDDPLPTHTNDEILASQKEQLPPGLMLVRMNKNVTGLHVQGGGVAVLERPDRPWRPLPAVTGVSRGTFIRSRVKIKFADGTKTTVRPYKVGFKGLLQTGQRDTLYVSTSGGSSGDGRYQSSWDGITGVFVLLAAVVLFPISLIMLAREMFGTSARAKQASLLVPQLKAIAR